MAPAPNMRSIIRTQRLLAELGHSDVGEALQELVDLRARAAALVGGTGAPPVALTEEQIDRAIRDLGLDYIADVERNRELLRALCMRAHRIAIGKEGGA